MTIFSYNLILNRKNAKNVINKKIGVHSFIFNAVNYCLRTTTKRATTKI